MPDKSKQLSFKGEKIYIGIDHHLKNWKVTIMTEHLIHKTLSQPPCAKTLARYLSRSFPDGTYLSAYEAGFCGFSIHRELQEQGIINIVVNPADIPTTGKEKTQKEDKRDSLKIAKMLRSGNLQGIHIPSIETEELRDLIRYRKTLVKEISRNKNRIKSFLYRYNIVIPSQLDGASRYWSGKFTQWLLNIETFTPLGTIQLKDLIDTTLFLRRKLLNITKEIRKVAQESNYERTYKLLNSIPGIGLVAAMTIISELGDISRFKSLDQLCSYIGLVPSTNSSGENEKTGNITPRANNILRSSIIESAWIATRVDPALILTYNKLCKRMKANKAIIRIAKKLLNRIRYVLKNETEYVYSVV